MNHQYHILPQYTMKYPIPPNNAFTMFNPLGPKCTIDGSRTVAPQDEEGNEVMSEKRH